MNFSMHANGRVQPARFVKSENCDARPPRMQIDALVLHAISLPPGKYGGGFVEQFFTNRLDANAHPYFREIAELRVSAHFFIDRAGALLQFVPLHLRAWHAGESNLHGRARVNDFSIGIELEGCDSEAFAEAQYKTLAPLARFLRAQFPAIAPARVVGHSDIAPGRKTDPGPHFDWARLRREISARAPCI